MNPELDRQPKPTWPFPGDTSLDRARKIALMYRARLRALSVDACDDADRAANESGETWVTPQLATVDDTDAITGDEAADLVNVTEDVIRQWACTPHPERPDEMLLPRFGWRGRKRTYLAAHVREAAGAVMRAKRRRSELTRSV